MKLQKMKGLPRIERGKPLLLFRSQKEPKMLFLGKERFEEHAVHGVFLDA